MNKELLEPIMRAHGDKNKDLAAAIGMSVPNFSTIWNGRGEFALKYIRLIARCFFFFFVFFYNNFIFKLSTLYFNFINNIYKLYHVYIVKYLIFIHTFNI